MGDGQEARQGTGEQGDVPLGIAREAAQELVAPLIPVTLDQRKRLDNKTTVIVAILGEAQECIVCWLD